MGGGSRLRIQGGTWPQVHLLGTAALVSYTGYTAQSRGRHATHTWNVTRLPDVDHGGVLADQRTPEREVLDALRRQPDTGFAIHDASGRIDRLRAERAELQALLRHRPPDRRPAFHQAELSLESAKRELQAARYRLERAEQRLEQLGPLSQLRRHGRHKKASTLDEIDRFTDDITNAEAKIVRSQRRIDELRPDLDERPRWDADHDWPHDRLRAVETELAGLTPAVRHIDGASRDRYLRGPIYRGERPRPGLVAEVNSSPLPDVGHGIDLGL